MKKKPHMFVERERERERGKYQRVILIFFDGLPYLAFFKSLKVCLRSDYFAKIENFLFKVLQIKIKVG